MAAPRVVVLRQGGQTIWWVLAVLLAIIATTLIMRGDESRWLAAVLAQTPRSGLPGGAGARGIYAFSGQLTAKTYGVWMLDADTGTIWCYELDRGANDELQMRLVSSRSWLFDRYLEEFNVGEPIPAAVRAMVQQVRPTPGGTVDEAPGTADGSGPALPDEPGK